MVGGAAAGLALWWLARTTLDLGRALGGPTPASVSEVLTFAAAAAALGCGLWLALSVGLALAGQLPGRVGGWARRLSEVLVPAVARRVAATLVGATLGVAVAPSTAAGSCSPVVPGLGATVAAAAVGAGPDVGPGWAPPAEPGHPAPPGPGWVPDRPTVRPQPSPRLLTTPPRTPGAPGVVVRRGDTLWGIVARQLGPDASAAEVAAAWPRWHRANRSVIGEDPHLILPGQVLRPPTASRAGS